jgi:glutathione S-transferase
MSNYILKLYYFDIRGRAEIIRLILAAANRSYKDIRFDLPQWLEYKSKMIIGQIPVLEFADNSQLTQSLTIARYLANETGLGEKTNLESARMDAVVDTQRDMNETFYKLIDFEKQNFKNMDDVTKFINDDLGKHCENIMKLKNAFSKNEKYFVGEKLSWADLFVYNSIDDLFRFLPQVKDKFNNQFQILFDTIHSNDNLKKYLDQRPETVY